MPARLVLLTALLVAALAGLRTDTSPAAANFVWVLQKTEANPFRDKLPPNATGGGSPGHIDWGTTVVPQAEFDVDFNPPPRQVAPGAKITFTATVTGKLTGEKTQQGFRGADVILLVNDRWVGSLTGSRVHCADPIGAEPISCVESDLDRGSASYVTPTHGTTFSVGIGVLNCGPCYVRYTYRAMARGSGSSPAKPPPASASTLGIDYTVPERFGRKGPDGLVHYPAKAEIRPQSWRVDFVVRRKDGKACTAGDVVTVSAAGATSFRRTGRTPCTFSGLFAKEGAPTITVRLRGRDGKTLKGTREIVVQDWLIVGLGDSNGSGEGTPDVPKPSAGVAARWQSVHCDRSANSYQAQTARMVERRDPRTSVTFVHLACSGASIARGLLGPYGGINPGILHRPQVKAMTTLAQGREIDAVIVSIGVNDLGFADLVKHCVAYPNCPARAFPSLTSPTTLDEVMQQRLAALTATGGLYDRLSRAFKEAGIPARRVVITEYFDSTKDEHGRTCDPLISTGLTAFDRAEAEWAAGRVLIPLNEAVRAAAQKHGWRLVTGSQEGFRRHGYCSQDPWIVGLTESLASQGDANGTLHSTTRGNTFQAARAFSSLRLELYANGRTRRPAP